MSRTFTILFAALTALLVASPLAFAQVPKSNPVTKCSQECLPNDDDVNGKTIKKGAESVKAILYGHFEDLLNRAPLNTQLPDPNKEFDLNRGFLMPVIQTDSGVSDADFHFQNNLFAMYSSAGLVEIFDGVWRTHQEPGLAEDVIIKSDTINLYWYMSAHAVPNSNSAQSPGTQANVAVMPEVAVKARMETGRVPYSSKSTVIAEGDTGKGGAADLVGGEGRVNMVSKPNEDPVYEFKVAMKVRPEGRIIPSKASADGFLVSVHPYQLRDPGAGDDPKKGAELMQADWRVRTGANFPPRLVLEVANPMITKAGSLSLFDNNMFIRWSFASPWGSYDTNDKSISIKLEGPTQADAKLINLVILKRSVDHDGHFKPINATWKFDHQKAGLADGAYAFKLSIENLQRTYVLELDLPFNVVNGQPDVPVVGAPAKGKKGSGAGSAQSAGDDSNGLPGFETVVLLAALVGAAALWRRRD